MTKRKNKLIADAGGFFREYQRKSQKRVEPNDRHYDRELERVIKALSPYELAEIMTGNPDLSSEFEDVWLSGSLIPGVKFYKSQECTAVVSPDVTLNVRVEMLIRLHPKPEYLVVTDAGEMIRIFQNKLSDGVI